MSTAALPVRVALIDDTDTIPTLELEEVAGALSEQVAHDFAPLWHVRASVGVYTDQEPGTWSILVEQSLDEPGALGYHTDIHNQPVSYVELTDDWPKTVSHELLEMLADPWGNRLHTARLPAGLELDYEQFGLRHESSRVHYLLEVCDPCEARSYEVGGVPVSDFLTHYWYRTHPSSLDSYSHAGQCAAPRQVADGGYVSFCNQDADWFQVFVEGGRPQISALGQYDRGEFASLREFTDSGAREFRARVLT